ncbi:dioxygenase family protein [Kangiella shandongensis]|uniref:dioxygenase family protein n=1 Tax=Kangiella shandongensis TaxID=2763258 RepID=UPI001CBE97A8|nr:class III extradiol ring-cleavage dioxygenase [Kangiella shandongensis]
MTYPLTMPALFLSHGSPMLAVENNSTTQFFQSLGDNLNKPRAIIVLSAHFDLADSVQITSSNSLETIHDFYGFAEELYQLQYPAHGAPILSQQIADTLLRDELNVSLNLKRGLDHGAWIPLMWLYPEADIPVIQMSIDSTRGTHYHYRLGQELKHLRQQGVLLIGSGGITHNLRAFFTASSDSSYGAKAEAFSEWIAQQLSLGQHDNLLNYKQLAPHANFNHPTAEHLYPLFVTLGATEMDEPIKRIHQAMDHQVLSLDAYQFG